MTNIRNLDLNLLVAFDTLYETRNVSRAADQLSLSQPAVSGMLARLRKAFSDPLFVRTQHGILPTPKADDLAQPIREVVGLVDALLNRVPFDPATAEATISISANDYLQEAVLVPFIGKLRQRAPGIRLSVMPPMTDGLPMALAGGDLDLALTAPELADPKLRLTVLYSEQYVCIARKSHPLPGGKISLKAFCAYDHLIVSPSRGSFTGPTDDALKQLGASRNVVISLPSFQTLLKTIQRDNFLALVPARILSGHMQRLKQYDIPFQVPDFDVIVCWHQIVDNDPLLKWTRALLQEVTSTGPTNLL